MAIVAARRRVDHGELQGDAAAAHAPRPARRRSRSTPYGGREFNGHVDSIAAATGARFSLLPPENATGNFVKVVQRVPVKIVLDAGQDPEHLLRPGHVGDADGVYEVAVRGQGSGTWGWTAGTRALLSTHD